MGRSIFRGEEIVASNRSRRCDRRRSRGANSYIGIACKFGGHCEIVLRVHSSLLVCLYFTVCLCFNYDDTVGYTSLWVETNTTLTVFD